MAKLRALARGFGAAGRSLGDIIARQEALAKEERARKAAIALEQLQQQGMMDRQRAQEQSALQRQILGNPQQAERLQSQGVSLPGLDVSKYGRSPAERISPLAEEVEKAQTPEAVPSAPGLLGRAQQEGLDTSSMPIPIPFAGVGQAAARPDIRELMRARQEKEGRTKAAVEAKMRGEEHIIPGTSQKGKVTPGGETLFTELSPTQKGQAETDQALSGKLSKVYAVAQGQAQNMVERLTRADKVATAGATSAAEAAGRLGEEFSLTNMAHKAQLAGMVSAAQTAGEAGAGGAGTGGAKPTQGERDAGAMFVALVNGHAKALEQEKKGAVIMPGLTTTLTSPIVGAVAGGMYPPGAVQYGSTALDFINTYTRLMSGVAARPDEIDRYTSSLFRQPSDTAKSAAQKQAARAVFMAAGQIKVQNSGYAAGRALGRAVEAGNMTPEMLAAIKYEPEILRGIMSVIDLPPELLSRMR